MHRVPSRAQRACGAQGEPSGRWLKACRSRNRGVYGLHLLTSRSSETDQGTKGDLRAFWSAVDCRPVLINMMWARGHALTASAGLARSCGDPSIHSSGPSGCEPRSWVCVSQHSQGSWPLRTCTCLTGGSQVSLTLLWSPGEGKLCDAKQGFRTGQVMSQISTVGPAQWQRVWT